MYQALYRKWRPRTFDEVFGQDHITVTLKNQVVMDRLSHAYLFIGSRGTGKTSCAKILARAVNCENPQKGNPCNKCESCLGIESGAILDVEELDAASNNGVDNIRSLRDNAVFAPVHVRKRVYIIDEVHMLSISAFNALLKILEEPPEHLMFILATTELHKVPATILSRCQRHSFRRVRADVIQTLLTDIANRENFQLTPDAAMLLARIADGSMRDAISLLDQCSGSEVIDSAAVLSSMGLAGGNRVSEIFRSITASDTKSALMLFEELWNDGKNPVTLLNELSSMARDILMLQIAPNGGGQLLSGGFDETVLRDYANQLSEDTLVYICDTIQETQSRLHYAQNPKMLAELCIVGLCKPELDDGIPALRARVARLESQEIAYKPEPAVSEPLIPDPVEPSVIEELVSRLKPEIEAKPDSRPEPETEPDPEPEVVLNPFNETEFLETLCGKSDPGIANILRNFTEITIAGNEINLAVESGFAYNTINKHDVISRIQTASGEILGAAAKVNLAALERKAQISQGSADLDSLAKFGATYEE